MTQTLTTQTPVKIVERYRHVRAFSKRICGALELEDCVVQSMPDASPLRWHLAHTTWFFETFVLKQHLPSYRTCQDQYAYLFNSYYNALGDQFPRAQRGVLSRPTLREVWGYRELVDRQLIEALESQSLEDPERCTELIELGLQHEQQHQELMLTDIKHAFSRNPLLPVYAGLDHANLFQLSTDQLSRSILSNCFQPIKSRLVDIGHDPKHGFAYDNEMPRHTVFIQPAKLATRVVTNGQYKQFIEDNGYQRPELWLSEGWSHVVAENWQAPLYWSQCDGQWMEFTLAGQQPLDLSRPVCHVSYFEADAFARWSGDRLPTEFEWESIAEEEAVSGNVSRSDRLLLFADQLFDEGLAIHPQAIPPTAPDFADLLGNVWEWTSSSYAPYPGYRPSPGAIGEYNGKFMCNQYVLRGGSCATSSDHIRVTYRNFFPAHARWQFSGVRMVRD